MTLRHKFTLFLTISVLLVFLASFSYAAGPKKKHQHAARARITASQATKTALKRYPGKVLGKVALENEDGRWQYSVNVKSGKTLREVMVDAKSGKIASVEKTTAAEERKEASAEKKSGHRK